MDAFFSHILQQFLSLMRPIREESPHSTGPTVRNRGQHWTLAYNLYSDDLNRVWERTSSVVEAVLSEKQLPSLCEVIRHNGKSGVIIDSNVKSFVIQKSIVWECYFYKEESLLFLRLLWEESIHRQNGVSPNQWISLDFDYISDCAWFEDTPVDPTTLGLI